MSLGQESISNLSGYAFPSVPLQKRIWRLNASSHADAAWNVAVRFRISGVLSISSLQKALDEVVARTEILRTSFVMIDGEVKQFVPEALFIPIWFEDHSGSENFERELRRISQQEAETPIEMQLSPLLRIVLVRQHAEVHYLLVTAHHSIMDGYSVGLFSDELLSEYERVERPNIKKSTGNNPFQFADYALWLEEYRLSDEYKEHAEYWKKNLEGISKAKIHPFRDQISAKSIHIESLLLPRSLTDAVQLLCQNLDVTFSQMALAVFACAADRLNTVIGVPFASRPEVRLEAMIGPFVNYLPLRIPSGQNKDFDHILSSVAEVSREALEHSEFRYEDILESKGLTNQSLFDTVFICQRDFVHSRATESIELTAIPSVSPGALYDLTVFAVERNDGWRLSCEVGEKYHGIAAKDILVGYQNILQSICTNPKISLKSLIKDASLFSQPCYVMGKKAIEHQREISFRMSATQERYWALNRIDPGSNRLNLHIRYAITSTFSPEVFRKALLILTERHGALRTFFVECGGDVRQHIKPTIELPLRHHNDPEGLLNVEEIVDLLEQEKRLPFDLELGPLWGALIITSAECSYFSLTLSHSICDGWSCGILMRELLATYDAIVEEKTPPLIKLTSTFGDLSTSDSKLNPSINERHAYWDVILSEPLPHLKLPTDGLEKSLKSIVTETRNIDPMLSIAAAQMARDHGATVANVYAAAYRALLLKYTCCSNLLIATPIANRPPGTEGVVGPFADSLLLRSSIGTTFQTALQATQNSLLSAVEHTVPLQDLMERLRHNNAEHGSAISIGFMYQEAFVQDLIGDHLALCAMESPLADFSFDWHMAVIDREGDVTVEFTTTQTSMSSELAALILEDYETSLSGYVLTPQKPLTKIQGVIQRINAQCEPARLKKQELSNLATLAQPWIESLGISDKATREMVEAWQQVFGRMNITKDDNFFAIGGHSLLLARLQVALEKKFGYRIFAADIFAAPTCELLVDRMTYRAGSEPTPLSRIISIQSGGNDTPLFIISQSMIVRELAEWLGPNLATFTIQFMQEDVEQLGSNATMQQIAALYIQHLRSKRPSGPYRLGGWCVSGWVAYEMAQQLRSSGEDVELLLILDAWAPNFWLNMRGLAKVLGRSSYYAHRIYFTALQILSKDGTDTGFWSRSSVFRQNIRRRLGVIFRYIVGKPEIPIAPETPFDEMMDFAAAAYRPKPYADDRTLIFRSAEQPGGGTLPNDMGWYSYLSRGVKVVSLPGDHTGMFSGLGAKMMSEHILYEVGGGQSPVPYVLESMRKHQADLLSVPLCLR